MKDEFDYCYLVVPTKRLRGKHWVNWVNEMWKELSIDPRVYRITDHGFLKIKCHEPIRVKNAKVIRVKDRTEHFDETLWPLVMIVYMRSRQAGIPFKRFVEVFLHLMLNVAGVYPEAPWLENLAKRRKELEDTITAKKDHGWELRELKKHGLLKRIP